MPTLILAIYSMPNRPYSSDYYNPSNNYWDAWEAKNRGYNSAPAYQSNNKNSQRGVSWGGESAQQENNTSPKKKKRASGAEKRRRKKLEAMQNDPGKYFSIVICTYITVTDFC